MPVFSPVPRRCSALLLSLALAACGGGGGSTGSEVPPPAAARVTLEATPAVLELEAGSGVAKTVTVTNTSAITAANNVRAALPGGWSDVVQDAGDCAALAAGASCELVFTPGNDTHPATEVTIAGTDTESASVTLSVTLPNSAALAAAGSPLTLEAGSGAHGTITITNTSTLLTASNIAADLTGTPLDGNVTQDASDCGNVLPQASCELRFTPHNTAVSLSHFPIRGDNTGQAGGAIGITLPTSAMISVSYSPVVLQASTGTTYAGGFMVTNNSPVLTATNIAAVLAGTALDGQVTQDASLCASVPPLANCYLQFTPHSNAVANTTVVVKGDNTSQASAAIAINAAPLVTVLLYPTALTLTTNGSGGTLTVYNQSTREHALNIGLDTTGTALAGELTVTGNTCGASVAPGANCTLTLTPGANLVGATTLPFAGDNTTVETAIVQIAQPIGTSHAGGIIFKQPLGNEPGRIIGELSTSTTWGSTMVTGALDRYDGAINTTAILAADPTAPAALFCADSTEDGYTDWFLPAEFELDDLMAQTDHLGGPISGVNSGNYWSSTEMDSDMATFNDTAGGRFGFYKSTTMQVRCVRSFSN